MFRKKQSRQPLALCFHPGVQWKNACYIEKTKTSNINNHILLTRIALKPLWFRDLGQRGLVLKKKQSGQPLACLPSYLSDQEIIASTHFGSRLYVVGTCRKLKTTSSQRSKICSAKAAELWRSDAQGVKVAARMRNAKPAGYGGCGFPKTKHGPRDRSSGLPTGSEHKSFELEMS